MTEKKIQIGDIEIYTRTQGPTDAPWITFCHSLATDHSMFDGQAAELSKSFRVLQYDRRGHGQTDAPNGPYTWDQLIGDVVGLWNELGIEKAHYVGLSMGGMTGIGLALKHPNRLLSLSACDCRADAPEFFRKMWRARQTGVEEKGMASIVDLTISTWFTEDRVSKDANLIDNVRDMILATPISGYLGSIEALKVLNFKRNLKKIKVRTQFIVGANDGPHPEEMKTMHDLVPGSKFKIIPNAAHLSNLEQPKEFNSLITGFIDTN